MPCKKALALLAERQQTYCSKCERIEAAGTTRLVLIVGEGKTGFSETRMLHSFANLHALCPRCYEVARDGTRDRTGVWSRAIRAEEQEGSIVLLDGSTLPKDMRDNRPGRREVPRRVLEQLGFTVRYFRTEFDRLKLQLEGDVTVWAR